MARIARPNGSLSSGQAWMTCRRSPGRPGFCDAFLEHGSTESRATGRAQAGQIGALIVASEIEFPRQSVVFRSFETCATVAYPARRIARNPAFLPASQTRLPPKLFSLLQICILPPKPLLPSLYKAFFAVKNPLFDPHFIRTVRSRFFRTMFQLSHDD